MDRCPTCRAGFRGDAVCSRCGTDLTQILEIEQAAARCRKQAFVALRAGSSEAAYGLAQRACDLYRSPDSVKTLALAALACRRFDQAVALWREYGGAAGQGE